jgi:hypothetical protein
LTPDTSSLIPLLPANVFRHHDALLERLIYKWVEGRGMGDAVKDQKVSGFTGKIWIKKNINFTSRPFSIAHSSR